jgi:GNAT superfamily N-acetyltransferase
VRPVSTRAFAGFADVALVQDVARRAWPSVRHPGGLGWALARSALAERIMLLFREDRPIGWAGADRSGATAAQIDIDDGRDAHLLVEWCLAATDAERLEVSLGDHDVGLVAAFGRAGFEVCSDLDPIVGMFRAAHEPPSPPACPPGYCIRATTPVEVTARVEAHRAAWLPSALPWHPEHRPDQAPAATSSYDLVAHEQVTRTALYDLDLDLVVEAPDGSLVGCCIVWLDPRLGVAEIEPLGIHPAHRRKGLAGALCHEAVARVARRGGSEVFINTGPRPAYPAPAAAYARAGFAVRALGRRYRLERG